MSRQLDAGATMDPQAPRGSVDEARGGMEHGFAALHVRNFRLYWSGQLVSLTGTWMQQIALPWLVLILGGDPVDVGIAAALQYLPATLLAPFGGVIADRVDKRRVFIAMQLLAMGQAATLSALAMTGTVSIPHVFGLALVLGLVTAVDLPLRHTLTADLVPRGVLPNAIAMNSMAFNTARVFGPSLAGIIIATAGTAVGSQAAGVGVSLGINALSYAAVLVGLLRMDPSEIRLALQPARPERVLDSLAEGLQHARRSPYVFWPLLLLGGVATLAMNFPVLLPHFSVDVLGLDADGYGALFAALGIGSMAGSLTIAFMRRKRTLLLMLGGGLVYVVLVIVLGLTRTVLLALPVVVGAGYFSVLMINAINMTVQANVDDRLRGRVMSLYVTAFAGSVPIGGLLAGAFAQAWGPATAFIIGAALSLIVIALVAWRLHRVRVVPLRKSGGG